MAAAGWACLVLMVAAATHTYARDLSPATVAPGYGSYGSYESYGSYGSYGRHGRYGSYIDASSPSAAGAQFGVRLATLPGGDPLTGMVEVRPAGPAPAAWGTVCAENAFSTGSTNGNAVPRLVCRHLGLPWRQAHAISLESFGRPCTPLAGYLDFGATSHGAGIDGWALTLQTFQQLWQSQYSAGTPYPGYDSSSAECPLRWAEFSSILAVRCTDDTPVPAVRLVAYGNMTGPGRGVLQVQLRPSTSAWLHTSYYRKDCPEGVNANAEDYLFDEDNNMFLTSEPMTAARVACRQLGLPYQGATMTWVDATQGPLQGGDGVRSPLPTCNGDEEDLSYCWWDEQSITAKPVYNGNVADEEGCIRIPQYAAVTCAGPSADPPWWGVGPPLPPAPPTRPLAPPGEAGVRLFNGSRDWGLVQVRVNVNGTQRWAAVCATGDSDDGSLPPYGLQAFAMVTCRELGRPTVGATKIRYWSMVAPGDLYLPRVDCKGNEQTMGDCAWSGEVYEVQACDDPGGCWCMEGDGPLGVSCRADPTDSGSIVGYRLEGGSNGNEGVVTAAVNNDYWDGIAWGNVCKEGFDDRAAQVVCRSLGKPYQQARAVDSGSFPRVMDGGNPYYAASLPYFLLDHVKCAGMESKLDQCARETMSDATYTSGPVTSCVQAWDAAAVVCA